MDKSDPDYAAFLERLPTLRRYEDVVRTRLHQKALQDPSKKGETLDTTVRYFEKEKRIFWPNRTFLKRCVVFANHVLNSKPVEEAIEIAIREHPDPRA